MGTLSYLARRLALASVTLLGITIVTFAIVAAAPGDAAMVQADESMDPRASARVAEEIRREFDLDKPLPLRYALWLRKLATGDLGLSISDHRPVAEKIGAAVGPTLSVNLLALTLALTLALPIGLASAGSQGGRFDRASSLVLYVLYSIPSYVGAIVLILFVGVKWNLLPFRGLHADNHADLMPAARAWDTARHLVLYVTCLSYGTLAYYSRFVRTNLVEVVRQDYIRTARAKGLSNRAVMLRHAFRNTLIPLVTLLGFVLPFVLSSSVILEVIFTWPGLGRLYFDSVLQRDFPVVMAMSTATACLVLVCTLAADMLYGVVDPRVSHG